ncbi:MAG: hypothetical protein HFJ91_10040 [Muribaculaceae bacterium]|nr:hypothetical protein [Muribaculaceae bacterium]
MRLSLRALGCLICIPALAAMADTTVTTTVDGVQAPGSLARITFDGDNVTLTYDDNSTQVADMSLVSVALDHDGSQSGIADSVINDPVKPSGVYNLKGQRLGDTPEGLSTGFYIVNGEKIFVK